MTYSLDFRRKVLDLKEQENLTYEEVATRFKIGVATLFRWNNRLEPKLNRSRPAIKIKTNDLLHDVETYPDAYQYERAKRFGVSQRGICSALKRMKISYKKTVVAPKSQQRGKTNLSKQDEGI